MAAAAALFAIMGFVSAYAQGGVLLIRFPMRMTTVSVWICRLSVVPNSEAMCFMIQTGRSGLPGKSSGPTATTGAA